MSWGTTKPLQDNLKTIQSLGKHHTFNFYRASNRAFFGMGNLTTLGTQNNSAISTYQTIVGYMYVQTSDDLELTDTEMNQPITSDDLGFSDDDTVFGIQAVLDVGNFESEDLSLSDSTDIQVYLGIQPSDDLELTDSEAHSPTFADDSLNITDFSEAVIQQIFDDLKLSDSIQIRRTLNLSFSTGIGVSKQLKVSFSTAVNVNYYDSAPITNLAASDNPSLPIVYINGTPLVNNAGGTVPPNETFTGTFVSFSPNWVLGGCNYTNFSANLTLGSNGTFHVEDEYHSPSDLPALGETATAFGLPGLITLAGDKSSQSGGKLNVVDGIFGNIRALNQQLLLIADTQGTSISGLIPVQGQPYPQSVNWTTLADAARGIAQTAGMNLAWLTIDEPLVDSFLESGMTVGDALRSLAQRVGGILAWAGGTQWVIIDPVNGYGAWTGPPCELVEPGGAEVYNILDLIGSILYLQLNERVNTSVTELVDPTTLALLNPPINSLLSTSNVIPSGAPSCPIDKKADIAALKIQILVTDSTLVGLSPYIVLVNNETASSDIWFDFAPALGETFDINTQSYKYQISNADFGSLTSSNNNNFRMNIGYTKDLTPAYNAYQQSIQQVIQREQALVASEEERIRYFKYAQGTIDYMFHGELPMPGQIGTFNYDGQTITGTIESVNLTYPYHLKVTIGAYILLNLVNPKSIIDYYLALGIGPPSGVMY